MGSSTGRRIVLPLTNKSGGGVIAGDVVIIDTGNDEAFTTTTSANHTGGVGIAQETIASNGVGRVLIGGYAALVNVTASVTRGYYGATSTTVKQAAAAASRGAGSFCQFLTGGATPTARVFAPDLAAAAGNVASDAIWDAAGDTVVGTGADTAGRLAKGVAGGVYAMGNGAVIWNAGTSFPASKATGDRYWRTDLGLEFYWDGTRWVTTHLYREGPNVVIGGSNVGAGYATATGLMNAFWSGWSPDYDIWIVALYLTYYNVGTNNGSNYWTYQLTKYDSAFSATSIVTANTSADAGGTLYGKKIAVGAAVANATYPILGFDLSVKTLSPGGIRTTVELAYRLIGV
jgi:hypothetical protein